MHQHREGGGQRVTGGGRVQKQRGAVWMLKGVWAEQDNEDAGGLSTVGYESKERHPSALLSAIQQGNAPVGHIPALPLCLVL